MKTLERKNIIVLIVETTIPPVSRANLRMYQLALELMMNPDFHVHMISPSFFPWRRKSSSLNKIIMNQYWGFSVLLYSPLRIFIRSWHFLFTIVSIVYLSMYFQIKHHSKIRVIHAWNPLAGIAGAIGAKIIGAVFFLDLTDFYSDIAKTDMPFFARALQCIESLTLQCADTVFVVSKHMKQYLTKTASINPKKIMIVPDGVDTDVFDPNIAGNDVKLQLGFQSSDTILLFHGDIKVDDGVDVLFDALRIVHAKEPRVKLLLLGGGGSYFRDLMNRMRSTEINSVVIHPGWIPHEMVPKYIAASDIGVMPMRPTLNHEQYLSFKLFEYWAMKKPVIVTKLCAISAIFKSGQAGLIVASNNPEEFADAILELVHDKRKANSMGAYGRTLVESQFNWRSIMKKEVLEYTKLLQKQ